MSQDYSGKTVLITGAASGLGYACAEAFVKAGALVCIADISSEAVEQSVTSLAALAASKDSVTGVQADVTKVGQVESMIATVVEKWGRLDVAVNNAGISCGLAPVAETKEEDFDRVIAVNLKGVWLCMRSELQQMEKQGGGSIVNMASALSTRVFSGACAYVSSKFAVAGLTRTAAVEYATKGIRINAICPGNVATPLVLDTVPADQLSELADLHAMKRLGTPNEIAKAVLWIASEDASFNTGTILPVDGGWNAH